MSAIYITETPTTYKLQFPYYKQLVDVMHRIPSEPRYDGIDKAWIVKIDDYRYTDERTARWYVDVFANWCVQQGYVSNIVRRSQDADFIYDTPPMKSLEGEHYMLLNPYPYQLEGVRYALDHPKCIFGDQPGLGKTLQAICAVVKAHNEPNIYPDTFPVLVICPATLKINWQREFKKFAGIDACILDDKNKNTWESYYNTKKMNGEPLCGVFITNYESLKKYFVKDIKEEGRMTKKNVVLDKRIDMFRSVIIDESHRCKSSKTQQTKLVNYICSGKKWIYELTGTPVVNSNMDLISQLKILGKLNDFGGYSKYVEKFCGGPKMSSNTKELNWRLKTMCFFRREKSVVLSQLPEKTRQYILCDITNRREYNDAERDIISYLREYKDADDDKVERAMRGQIMVKMGILKSIAAKGKIKAMSDFIHDIIDGGEKLIVFAFLKEVVDELKNIFPDAVTVTGSDSVADKQKSVDAFQNDPETKLIILNYKSGGVGLTLTAASRVAFIEFPWTYAECEQAEDRAHRNGQKNNVNCYYFLGNKTIDKYMYDVVQSKKTIADEVTGTTTQIEENMINITMNLFKDRL